MIVWDWGTWEPEAETPDPARPSRTASSSSRSTARSSAAGSRSSGRAAGRAAAPRTRVRGRRGRAVAAHPQARRRTPSTGWDAEDHPQSVKTGRTNDEVKANRAAVWISQRAGRDRRDRPLRRQAGADAALPRADGGDPRDQGVQRRGLAVRDQVGRLPRRGGRRGRQGQDLHPQRQRRRDLLPAAAHPPTLDRGRRRRSSTARSSRSTRTACPTSACSRSDQRRRTDGERCRSCTRRSTCSTSTAGRCSTSRSRSASSCSSSCSRPTARVRFARPRRHRGRRLLRGGQGPAARGDRRQAPRGRATSRASARRPGSRSRSGRSRSSSSAAGRPGRGTREGPRRAGRRRLRGRQAALRGQGRLGVRRRAPGRTSASASSRSRPTSRRSTRRRRRTTRAAGAATCGRLWVQPGARHPGRARRLDPRRPRPPGGVQGLRGGRRAARRSSRERPVDPAAAEREAGGDVPAPEPVAPATPEAGQPAATMPQATAAPQPPPRRRARARVDRRADGGARRARRAARTRATWKVGGHELKLTNLDKVALPGRGTATTRRRSPSAS